MKCSFKVTFPIFLMLVILLSSAKAQIPNIEDFTIYNQVSHNIDRNVTGLYQDRQGFIWFSGSENIFRFDGINFTSILELKDIAFVFPQINAGRNDILQDLKNRYWFLTYTDLVRWDPRQPTNLAWTKYSQNEMDSIPLPTNKMHRIAMDSKGFIWLVFDGGDLYKIDPDTGKAIQRIDFRIEEPGMRRSEIDAMEYNSADNRIYFGADYLRIIAVNPDNGLIEYPHLPLRTLLKNAGIYNMLSRQSIADFAKDSADWWLSLTNNMILRYSFRSGTYKLFGPNSNNNKMAVSRIKKGAEGLLWCADVRNGLHIINPATNLMRPISKGMVEQNNHLGNVLDIFFDRDNVLWLATSRCLAKYNPNEHLFMEYSPYKEIAGTIPHIYYQDNLENEFIGTNNGLLYKYKNDATFSRVPFTTTDKNAIDIISIQHWFTDYYLLGTTNGLYQFDLIKKKIQKLDVSGDPYSVIQYYENPAHSIVIDTIENNPVIWLASKLRFLFLYDVGTKNIKVILPNENDSTAYPHQVIQKMLKTQNGDIWLTTSGGGLSKIVDKRSIKFKNWQHIANDSTSLQNNNITDFVITDNGNFWLSSITGIDLFDHRNFSHIQNPYEGIGLANNMIKGTKKDVWSISGNDLIRWTQEGKLLTIYPKGTVNFNTMFIKKNSEIILWESKFDQFTDFTSNKIYAFEDWEKHDTRGRQITLITGITIGLNDSSHMKFRQKNRLNYTQNNISFTFSSPSYTHSESNQFMWKLYGIDKNWIKSGNNTNTTNYANLQPGIYTFRVKSCNSYGIWDEVGDSFSFTIQPPWYNTFWLKLLVFIMTICVFWYIIHRRTAQLLAIQRIEIEKSMAIDAERKRIARDMHDDLGSGLSAIHLYSEYLKNSLSKENPSLSSNLDKIVRSSNDLIQKVKEIIWANETKECSSATLISFVKTLVEELSGINAIRINVDDSSLTENVILNQKEHKNIYLCIKESINNAIKYAYASEININFFSMANHKICIEINDNGRGFKVDYSTKYGSNGLRNINVRMLEIGGAVNIHSDSSGTKIHLEV